MVISNGKFIYFNQERKSVMNPRKPFFFITSEDAALREFVHSPGKLHKEQRAAVELGKILLELCNCADRLYRLANEGTGIDIVLRGEMQGNE